MTAEERSGLTLPIGCLLNEAKDHFQLRIRVFREEIFETSYPVGEQRFDASNTIWVRLDENASCVVWICDTARESLPLEAIDHGCYRRARESGVRRKLTGCEGPEPAKDVEGLFLARVEVESLSDGCMEHHRRRALLATRSMQRRDELRASPC